MLGVPILALGFPGHVELGVIVLAAGAIVSAWRRSWWWTVLFAGLALVFWPW